MPRMLAMFKVIHLGCLESAAWVPSFNVTCLRRDICVTLHIHAYSTPWAEVRTHAIIYSTG